jgi:dipeptide/tripeptide permease
MVMTDWPLRRCYVIPLFGAYVADTYWGRFKTIGVSVFIALIGHIILIISGVPGVIEHKGAIGVFVVAILVTGLGTGGFKSNISPLVAEQYKRTKQFVITTDQGERVIVDPTLTTSRIYMVGNVTCSCLRALSRLLFPLVLLPLHQHWGIDRSNWYDLC